MMTVEPTDRPVMITDVTGTTIAVITVMCAKIHVYCYVYCCAYCYACEY